MLISIITDRIKNNTYRTPTTAEDNSPWDSMVSRLVRPKTDHTRCVDALNKLKNENRVVGFLGHVFSYMGVLHKILSWPKSESPRRTSQYLWCTLMWEVVFSCSRWSLYLMQWKSVASLNSDYSQWQEINFKKKLRLWTCTCWFLRTITYQAVRPSAQKLS